MYNTARKVAKKRKKMTYLTKCDRNPEYPKIRLICGHFERIASPTAVPDIIERRPLPIVLKNA